MQNQGLKPYDASANDKIDSDLEFNTMLSQFRVQQFEYFSQLNNRSEDMQTFYDLVSKWHSDIHEIKSNQSRHYQNEIDTLLDKIQVLKESHGEELRQLKNENDNILKTLSAEHEAELANKEKEMEELSGVFVKDIEKLQSKIGDLEEVTN